MGRAHEVRAKAMAATAAKKSKLYSIYAKEIYQAAKGNPDPTSNDVLRRVIEKAKKEQVPADVINRNIDKVKKGVAEDYQTVEYEAFAQGGSSLIIKCLTTSVIKFSNKFKSPILRKVFATIMPGNKSNLYQALYAFGTGASNSGGVPYGGSLAMANRIANNYEHLGGFIHYGK